MIPIVATLQTEWDPVFQQGITIGYFLL